MIRNSARRSGAAALLHALMLGAALPALTVAAPAAAQAFGERRDADHPVWVTLLTRSYFGDGYQWKASHSEPRKLSVELTETASSGGRAFNRRWYGELTLSSDRRSLQGELTAFQDTHLLKLKVTTSNDAGQITLQDAGSRFPIKTAILRQLTSSSEERNLQRSMADWIGDWSVNGQTLRIRADSGLLVGTSYAPTSGGREREVYRFTFQSRGAGNKLVGAWQEPQLDASPYSGGAVELELTPDKQGFVGDIYSTGRADSGFRGVRSADGAWRPTVVQGDVQPKAATCPATPGAGLSWKATS
jgi:hypothetical protein